MDFRSVVSLLSIGDPTTKEFSVSVNIVDTLLTFHFLGFPILAIV
jgi:hypothetical protein